MANKGMKYITNGISQRMIHVDEEVPEGFHYGKLPASEETRAILSKAHKGKKLSKSSIDKMKDTFKKKYGVSSPSQLPGVSKKISYKLSSKEVQDKMKSTNLERYGSVGVLGNQEIKNKMRQTILDRYGDENYNNKDKEYETRKINGTLGLFETAPEKELYKLFVNEYGADDVIKQYRSKEYPFKCDFYIKSLDVYIEYNGFWTHNTHPFDCTNLNDVCTAENWERKGYHNAVYTWTDLDVRKRKYMNKVNLIIFYPDRQDDIVCSFMKIKAELDSYKK